MSLVDAFGVPYPEIARWVVENYLGISSADQPTPDNHHIRRRNTIAERLRFYRDSYGEDVLQVVDRIFTNDIVKQQRKRFAEMAMGFNPTRRIIDEISTVYARPAVRGYDGNEIASVQLRVLDETIALDDLLLEANRLTNLCNEVLIWNDPSIRLVTPDTFDVIPDPVDPLSMAGLLMDWRDARGAVTRGEEQRRQVHWRLWDEDVFVEIDGHGVVMRVVPHGLGRIPGVLVHRKRPTTTLLDGHSGQDIVSAHKSIVLLNLMLLKLAKSSGENQTVISGNLAAMATGQPLDAEMPIGLPPGVDAEVLNLKTDPGHYLDTIRHMISSVALTYGMSYEQFTREDTSSSTSGRAYKVRKEALVDMRRRQSDRWARTEREVVALLGLPSDGYSVNHAEMAVPSDAMEEFKLFLEKSRQGLDNHLEFLKREDPALDDRGAERKFLRNLDVWSRVIALLRALNAPADANAEDPGQDPEDNGEDDDEDESESEDE